MADLRLNILGDSTGATVALNKVQASVAALGKVLVQFGEESLKAFEDQEKADRRLAAVAGESTEALKAQASALQSQIGVSDDYVQGLQAMLATYGQAPAEIDNTVRAVLDLSAATGQDATAATNELLSAVTSGKMAFKELGLQYDTTGTRAEVLASATAALQAKFGGSAAGESDSLSGQVKNAKAQFGELQESFGAVISEFISKSGVVSETADLFKNLNQAIFGTEDYSPKQKAVIALSDEIGSLKATFQDLKDQGASLDVLEPILDQISKARAKLRELNSKPVLSGEGVANLLKAGGKDKADKHLEEQKALNEKIKRQEEQDEKDREEARRQATEEETRFVLAEFAQQERWREEEARKIEAAEKKAESERKKTLEKEKQDLNERQRQYEQAGAAIGGAFANALSSALSQLAEGGEVDAVSMTADILSAVVSAAVSLIPGFGAFAGIAGQLTGVGVRAIGTATGGTKTRRHNGGWAGDGMARYHLGTWVGSDEEPAILQTGERVLARNEVAAMGGKRGVEAAVKGRGGGSIVNIQTFDAGSFREIFSGRGKQGLIDANRTGHGAASFFGGR